MGTKKSTPEAQKPSPHTRARKPPERLVGEAHIGGLGGWGMGDGGRVPPCRKSVPQKIQTRGRRPEGAPTRFSRGGVFPLAGGESEAHRTVPALGGWAGPVLKKLIPNTAQQEAAQGNYNINELMVNRCCGGLFAPGAYLPPASAGHPRSLAQGRADPAGDSSLTAGKG
jgi:hypothetical protein